MNFHLGFDVEFLVFSLELYVNKHIGGIEKVFRIQDVS